VNVKSFALAALVLGLPACGAGKRANTAEVAVIVAKQQKFARVIDAQGALRAVRSTPVTVPRDVEWPLRITWLAADGAIIKKGEPLARFDDLELKERLANARSDRAVAAAKREKEAALLQAAAQERVRSTAAASRELSMTQTFARRDAEIFARDQIIESEIDEQFQAAKVDNAKASETVEQRLSRSKLGVIAVEGRKADDAIRRSEKGLDSLEITAPHEGVFTLKRNWNGESFRVGDTVFRSMTVAEISLVEKMEAEVFVLEAEAAGLAKGKKADIVVEAQPDKVYGAKVKQVETVAKRRNPKSPTQYFGVILDLGDDARGLKPGQRVRARLHLHEETALVVPRPTIFDRDGAFIVYRKDATGFSPVPVKLGPSTAGLVTITSGLRAGDEIALRDPGKAVDELLPGSGPQTKK
jgi:multidrug resistance efflux pump